MGDAADNTEDELSQAARNVLASKRNIAIRLLKQLAEGEVTAHAKPTPRRDWIEARKQPGKVADLLAAFIKEKFADELADRTMTTQKLYRFAGLHCAFYNHKAELPVDLQDMQTRSELYDRMVAEGEVTPPETVRSAERDRKRIVAAQSRHPAEDRPENSDAGHRAYPPQARAGLHRQPVRGVTKIKGYEDLQSDGLNVANTLTAESALLFDDATIYSEAWIRLESKDPHWSIRSRALWNGLTIDEVEESAAEAARPYFPM